MLIRITSYGGGITALWRYRHRSSQEYFTPGCQVFGGYEKLGTLPDMISSPGRHFAVLDHVKIILWHLGLDLCEGKKMNAPPGLSTKYHIYGAMPPSTSITVCIQVNSLPNRQSSLSVGCFCWDTLWCRRGIEKGIETRGANGVGLYDLLDSQWYTLGYLVVTQCYGADRYENT